MLQTGLPRASLFRHPRLNAYIDGAVDAVTGALGFVGQRIYVKTSTLWIIRPYDVALPLVPLIDDGVFPVTIIDSYGLTNRASI